MTNITKFLLTAVFTFSTTATASAQVIVQGGGAAQACFMSAKSGNLGSIGAIRRCEEALKGTALSREDEAATHVNLGVLLMRKGDNTEAQKHYKRAIKLRPSTPESYINYGASLIYTGDYQAAISAINTAIELGTEKMPEALFNRAMAYDRTKDYRGAYKDLKQALVLRPEWPIALKALENYQVKSRTQKN